jgi:hypothetical protein
VTNNENKASADYENIWGGKKTQLKIIKNKFTNFVEKNNLVCGTL